MRKTVPRDAAYKMKVHKKALCCEKKQSNFLDYDNMPGCIFN